MKAIKLIAIVLGVLLGLGVLIPEKITIPVKGATKNDWNHNTFWYAPWGKSGVHKGIDIFGTKGTPVVAAVSGIVLYTGELGRGGKVVALLGPKWRVHYFAHLEGYSVSVGEFVLISDVIGSLGDTGNAKGKQPHVHYSIVSLLPLPWRITTEPQGYKKMFFLNPHEKLVTH